MAKKTRRRGDTNELQFSVNLSEIDLTDEEVNSLHNQITKLLVESLRKKPKPKPEPYVKVLHVKSIPNPP